MIGHMHCQVHRHSLACSMAEIQPQFHAICYAIVGSDNCACTCHHPATLDANVNGIRETLGRVGYELWQSNAFNDELPTSKKADMFLQMMDAVKLPLNIHQALAALQELTRQRTTRIWVRDDFIEAVGVKTATKET